MLMITMGARQVPGLFVFPISGSTGVSIVTISFAMAVGQFMWGLAQPVAGACADRFGFTRVLIGGVLLLAVGHSADAFFTSSFGFVVTIGILTAVGSGAGSFSVLIGALAQRLEPRERALASGLLTGGGSFGQFLFAPIVQKMITLWGWMGAMWSLGAIRAISFAAGEIDCRSCGSSRRARQRLLAAGTMRAALRTAFGNSSYLLLHGSFSHLRFSYRLPRHSFAGRSRSVRFARFGGELVAGDHRSGEYSPAVLPRAGCSIIIAANTYCSVCTARALSSFSFTSPRRKPNGRFISWLSAWVFLGSARAADRRRGGKTLSARAISATLYGLTMLSHQIGGFFGAWLGGLAFSYYGNYLWMWYADALFAAIAALLNLPIREPRLEPRAVPA
jgi:MFS family permease